MKFINKISSVRSVQDSEPFETDPSLYLYVNNACKIFTATSVVAQAVSLSGPGMRAWRFVCQPASKGRVCRICQCVASFTNMLLPVCEKYLFFSLRMCDSASEKEGRDKRVCVIGSMSGSIGQYCLLLTVRRYEHGHGRGHRRVNPLWYWHWHWQSYSCFASAKGALQTYYGTSASTSLSVFKDSNGAKHTHQFEKHTPAASSFSS